MVMYGFSLLDVRKLYYDEMEQYYFETVFNLEAMGRMKEGTYNKLMNNTRESAKSTVASLRKQLFSGITKKRKV